MSHDVLGHITQSVDHGEFVSIPYKHGTWRVRAASVIGYTDMDQSFREGIKPEDIYILRIDAAGIPPMGLPFDSTKSLQEATARLDWHFKKEQRK